MTNNPFLKRVAKAGQTGKGRVSERRVARKIGARQTPGSGSGNHKGDMLYGGWLVEAKATANLTAKLDLSWLVKIAQEALNAGKNPAVAVSFIRPDGSARPRGDWVMMPLQTFQELTGIQAQNDTCGPVQEGDARSKADALSFGGSDFD